MEELPEGVVTFLFSDIEGSTRRWREDAGMAEVLERHDALVKGAIAAAGGHWVKHTGDGVLAVFGVATDAVIAAVDIQLRLAGEPDLGLKVRIGIHTGEAGLRDGDYFGLAVSSAARVMDAGHGGQILVSEGTRAVIGTITEAELIDLGTHRLKDLGEAQRLHQVSAPGLGRDFPPLRSLELVEHNLPLQLTSFVGREQELADITELVERHRLVTLTGVGGAGKTRLSLQVAAELVDRYDDGVWLVELATVNDPDAVPSAVGAALGIRREKADPSDLSERIVRHLTQRSLLLVVDNCEHVIGAAAAILERILSRAPDVTVLASSREGLGIRGERLYQVPSLRVAGNGARSEAAQLFIDRAQAVSPHLVVDDPTRSHIDRICRILDGIPLAIELAAARARVLAPAQISERLDDRFRLLTGGSKAALPRQQTLEAAIDWSYQLLSGTERLLFDRLSVFVGGFTLEAAEAVCSGQEVDDHDVIDLLDGLVDKSMVVAERDGESAFRYRLLETLRQYGLRRLGEDPDRMARWKVRHLEYFAREAERRSPLTWTPSRHVEWYAAESGNLSAAIEWARSERSHAIPMLASALGYHQVLTAGDPDAALALCDEAIAEVRGNAPLGLRLRGFRLLLLATTGAIADVRKEWGRLESELGSTDDDTAAWVLRRVSMTYAQDPELDAREALEIARAAVRRSERLGVEPRLETLRALAWAMLWVNTDTNEAMSILETAVELARGRDDDERLLSLLSTLSLVCHTSDQRANTALTDAVEDEMLEVWERRGRVDRAEYVMWIGIRRGRWDLAEWEIAAQERELEGRRRDQYLMPRAMLRWMQGRYEEADADFDEVERLGPVRRWHHDYYPTRAEVAAFTGDLARTRAWVERHFEFPMEPAEEIMRLGTLRPLVMAHVDAGDLDGARSTLDRMRSISEPPADLRVPIVQVGSEVFYLESAEAELTRLDTPDPDAWTRAERSTFWPFWSLYCRVRELEARAQVGESVFEAAAALNEELNQIGALGLAVLLDEALVDEHDRIV